MQRGLYQLSPGNRDAVHRLCPRERMTWFHQEQLLPWVLIPRGPLNETQRNWSAIQQLHTPTHAATESSATLLVTIDRLRNAGNGNEMWSQFLMRLELESICSSWTGIRQLLPSERQIKQKMLYRVEGSGKGKPETFLVSWMTRHLRMTFGSVLVFPDSSRKHQVWVTVKIHFTFALWREHKAAVTCLKSQAAKPFLCLQETFEDSSLLCRQKSSQCCLLKDCWFQILSVVNGIPCTKLLHHFCKD